MIQILQPPLTISSNQNHLHPLIEIIGGTVIIGTEYTPLQQIVMVDYYYTCTITITVLLGFMYYGIIYFVLFRQQQRRRQSNWSHRHHPSNSPYSNKTSPLDTNGSNYDYDDVHNFDYMDDLHINEENGDDNQQDDSNDWVPLYDHGVDHNHHSNPVAAENHSFPTDRRRRQRHSNNDNFHEGNDHSSMYEVVDDELFFDAIPFLPDHNHIRHYNNCIADSLIGGDIVPMDESIITTPGIGSTIPVDDTTKTYSSVHLNDPITTNTTVRTDNVPRSQCDIKLQQQWDIMVRNDTAKDSSMPVPLFDNVPSIASKMTATRLNDSSSMNVTATSSTVLLSSKAEVRPDNDNTSTVGTMTNDPIIIPNQPHEGTKNETDSTDDEIDNWTDDAISTSPSQFHSLPLSVLPVAPHSATRHHALHAETTTRTAPATEDVDGTQMIQILWSELQHRNRTAEERSCGPTEGGTVDSGNQTNHRNISIRTNQEDIDDFNNRGGMYQEYPFLALLHW